MDSTSLPIFLFASPLSPNFFFFFFETHEHAGVMVYFKQYMEIWIMASLEKLYSAKENHRTLISLMDI